MADDIVTRLLDFTPLSESDLARLMLDASDEIEHLRQCLQHAIDHVGKWGLLTTEEKQAILAEYQQAVR